MFFNNLLLLFLSGNKYFSFGNSINITSVYVAVIDVHSALCKAVMVILSAILFAIKLPVTIAVALIQISHLETVPKASIAADFFVLLRNFCPYLFLKI